MATHRNKKEIERKGSFMKPEKLDVLDEAERLYAADAEAAHEQFRQDGQPPREGE
jgi:hypothetical protein